jgi:hypothetical protein
VKDTLDSLVAELEAWQARFDPTWYLIILISGSVLDPVLAESRRDRTPGASARGNPLDNMLALRLAIEEDNSSTVRHSASLAFDAGRLASITETIHMRYTSAKAVLHAGTSELLIMEPVDLSAGVSSQSISDVERLARRLQNVDPDTFGILQCEGILRETDPLSGHLTALDVVYRAPAGTQRPTTLRHLLLTQREVSLNAIVSLAKQLVRSVSYIHAWYVQPHPSLCGRSCTHLPYEWPSSFVHKNIRAENILLFPSSATSPMGSAYLLGFTHFRSLTHETNHHGDSAWHRNLCMSLFPTPLWLPS